MSHINLDEILRKEWGVLSQEGDLQLAIVLNSDVKKIKAAMLEFGKILLDAAADNAETEDVKFTENDQRVNRDSITSVINEVKL